VTINDKFPLKDNGFSNTIKNFDKPRHRWYYFKEGFSPSLVEFAIKKVDVKSNDLILDPFNGSGTVTLVGAENRINSIGIEVNPFASFLSKAKIGNVSLRSVLKEESLVIKNVKVNNLYSPLLNFSTFSKTSQNVKWLFNRNVLNPFHTAFTYTKQIRNIDVRNLFRLSLIGAALDNCNALRDGKCLKYRNGWEELKFGKNSFLESFTNRLSIIKEDIKESKVDGSKIEIINGDSRQILNDKIKQKFKLCITSPPYLNSFDYTDVYRPELFLGNFIRSQAELLSLRKKTLRSHAAVSSKNLGKIDFGVLYAKSIEQIVKQKETTWQRKIPIMIQSYFEDMSIMFENLKSNAEKDAQLWLVVSNSAYNDVELPVDLILADIGCKKGWKLEEIGVLRYLHKRGTKYSPDINCLRESVVIFRA
jgi:DNA modification methylase